MCDGAAGAELASSPQFRIGQARRYQTRPGEGASRAIIGRIERIEGIGRVVHVKLTDVKLMSSAAPGSVATIVFHVPVREDWFAASLVELTPEHGDLEGFAEGYGKWLAAYRKGEAGCSYPALRRRRDHGAGADSVTVG